ASVCGSGSESITCGGGSGGPGIERAGVTSRSTPSPPRRAAVARRGREVAARHGARLHTTVNRLDRDASALPRTPPSRWLPASVPFAYLALTILLTRPGAARFVTHFMGRDTDGHAWGLWWIKTALLRGDWPWWTDRLFAPDGVPLYFHTLAFTNGLIALPVQLVWPLTVAYNVVVVTSF